jgi:hypothetical protein
MRTRVIPIAPALHLLAQQAGFQVSIATALTPSALVVAMSAHTVFTSKLAWQITLLNLLETAYRSLSDPT